MKPALVFSIPSKTANGYCWRWRSLDGEAESAESFVYYFDCLADARANGYVAQPTQAQGTTAPGYWSVNR